MATLKRRGLGLGVGVFEGRRALGVLCGAVAAALATSVAPASGQEVQPARSAAEVVVEPQVRHLMGLGATSAVVPFGVPSSSGESRLPTPELAPSADSVNRPLAADLGMQAYFVGSWSAAAELLLSVPSDARGPLDWLHLARAQAAQGMLVEAWDSYNHLRDIEVEAAAALADGLLATLQRADSEAAAVETRIPWAQITLGASVPKSAVVFVDQQRVEQSRVDAPYPVNPGWHTFLVEDDGQVWAAQRLKFEEGQQVAVPLLRTAYNPLADADGASSQAPVEAWAGAARQAVDTSERAMNRKLRLASYVSLGVGVAGTLVGTGFALRAVSQKNALNRLGTECEGAVCRVDPALQERAERLHSDSVGAGNVATGGFVVGALGLVAGGILFFLGAEDDRDKEDQYDPGAEPFVGLGSVGITGRF